MSPNHNIANKVHIVDQNMQSTKCLHNEMTNMKLRRGSITNQDSSEGIYASKSWRNLELVFYFQWAQNTI